MSAGFPRGGSVYGIVARVLGAVCAVCLICLPLLSQTNQGTIQGGVFDQTGGAVAGATVSVVDVARGVTRTLTTDGAGQYIANALTPGTYTVRAEAKGFRAEEHSGVLVEVGQNVRMDLVVQPGEQTQTITVTVKSRHRYVRRHPRRNGEQSIDQHAAFERTQLRALAATASGNGYCSGNGNGQHQHQRPARGQRHAADPEGIANINCCQGSTF